jgi:Arc/MetJ-type ribon-helix-helix transcriptional regulator
MQTTIELPDELARQIETLATQSGRSAPDVIRELLERGLAANGEAKQLPTPVIKTDPKTGFPYIEPTGEPPRKLTIAEALALEQQSLFEEDMERMGVPLR